MIKYLKFSLSVLVTLMIISCNKTKDQSVIVYQTINKDYVLIRDVKTLQASQDEISTHVDSILSGLINTQFVSTGTKVFDLSLNEIPDIGFEIIDLNPFNPNGLPAHFDSLAARVIPMSLEILDNSTFGYCDALDINEQINSRGNWTSRTCVLGTFMNAGNFQGQGEKFLGFRFNTDRNYKYGWIRIYCSQHSDTLRIIDYAYNDIVNSKIFAGQMD